MQRHEERKLEQASAILAEIRSERGLSTRERVGFHDFKLAMYPNYIDGYHLRCLDHVLERVVLHIESEGKHPDGIPNLIISMPRRYSKSTTVELFAAWYLGRNPNHRLIITSFGQQLTGRISRAIRNVIHQEKYRDFYPGIYLAEDSKSRTEWDIEGFLGGATARPVQAGATGSGFHCLVADDLVRNREDAESPQILDKVWAELTDSYFSGANVSYAGRVIIGTRWSVNDPIGRLLEAEPEKWVNFRLPALVSEPYQICDLQDRVIYERKPDEPLWTFKHSVDELKELANTIPMYSWASLWQQEPIETLGNFFKREWFKVLPRAEVPALEYVVRYWDLAMSDKRGSDYTVGLKMGCGVDGKYYILDVARWQVDFGELVGLMAQEMIKDGPSVSQGVEMAGYMTRAVADLNADPRLHGYSVMGYGVDKSKEIRATPVQGKLQTGMIRLLRGAWNDDYINEMCAFIPDKSKYDDQVDATSGAWAMMDTSLDGGWTSWM